MVFKTFKQKLFNLLLFLIFLLFLVQSLSSTSNMSHIPLYTRGVLLNMYSENFKFYFMSL